MKLFLDTNVLLDHAMARPTGEAFEAKFLLSWALENEIPMYISVGSFYTFTYVLQKNGIRNEQLRNTLINYLSFLRVCQTTRACFIDGLESGFKDIEDSFQHYTALTEGCDFLLTTNIKDFESSKGKEIQVMPPSKFLTKILKKKSGIDF
jgi:predicted nucleic acid-binding protein